MNIVDLCVRCGSENLKKNIVVRHKLCKDCGNWLCCDYDFYGDAKICRACGSKNIDKKIMVFSNLCNDCGAWLGDDVYGVSEEEVFDPIFGRYLPRLSKAKIVKEM